MPTFFDEHFMPTRLSVTCLVSIQTSEHDKHVKIKYCDIFFLQGFTVVMQHAFSLQWKKWRYLQYWTLKRNKTVNAEKAEMICNFQVLCHRGEGEHIAKTRTREIADNGEDVNR